MGNNQSSDSRSRTPQSPASTQHSLSHAGSLSHDAKNSHDLQHSIPRTRREPRRRQSIQEKLGLGSSNSEKVGKAPPIAEASTATAEPYKSSSGNSSARTGSVQSIVSATGGVAAGVGSRIHHTLSKSEASVPEESEMGNEQSKPLEGRRDGAKLSRQSTREDGSSLSRQQTKEIPLPPQIKTQPHSEPVKVPSGHSDHGTREEPPMSPISPTQSASYSLPVSAGFSRPPRLPLPIEEEEYVPGSPVLSPADIKEAVDPLDDGGPHRTRSMLSGTTVDDDVDDIEEGGLVGEAQGPSVPTIIEWRGPGDKVYVTGTFAAWDRKYRLHQGGPSRHKDALSVIINLQPGTHHLKFIVDGDMRLSDSLPTAVDYTNILVNYIEVSADDRPAISPPAVHAPGAPVVPPPATEPIAIKPPPSAVGTGPTGAGKSSYKVPSHIRPPQVLPPTPELQAEAAGRPATPAKVTTSTEAVSKPPTKTASGKAETRSERMATKYYHNVVPQFLLDGDTQEETSASLNAQAVFDTLPAPPTLPLFLSKSVLNGAMPMKDDASVLVMPNHTVLNHLATSSIRGGTLATSATTRYKQKFVTTITFMPKGKKHYTDP